MDSCQQENFVRLCRNFKWKCTPQRLAVYECVADNRCHPDVDSVWEHVRKKLPTVTRESVYRILNEFAGHNIIWRLDHVNSARYDSNTLPHGHFICEECGAISDFALENDVASFANAVPGEIRHMEIRFTGLCSNCCSSPGDNRIQK
ncbi:MAG: transcriptional repressor [Lentisphaerae bacterium]|nr:transcriptional repressor [Lentisphaerota bacterium]